MKIHFINSPRGLYAAGLSLFVASLFSACETPQSPVGRPSIKPSASASVSSPANDEPLCLQTLQCVIDSTANNTLRKETQEAINLLFKTAEPKYTQLCQAKAEELSESIPKCVKTATASPLASPSTDVKPGPSTLPKSSAATN